LSSDLQELPTLPAAPARSLTERFLDSGLIGAFGVDLITATGLALIGVGVHQLLPVATWIYAGLVVLVLGLALGRTRAQQTADRGEGA